MRDCKKKIDIPEKHPNVSVKAVLKWKNKILILQHGNGSIDFPGGRMEFKETLLGTLRRELEEELNYTLSEEPELFDVWNYISKNKRRHSVLIFYIVELLEQPKNMSLERGVTALWLTKDQFLQKNIIQNRDFLEKLFRWQKAG
ncbi:MAG: NUDIX hydrolase [Patescibacteria group bacterium]|nr:NUDIX hydrolase [Patescibacteria group bacterium]